MKKKTKENLLKAIEMLNNLPVPTKNRYFRLPDGSTITNDKKMIKKIQSYSKYGNRKTMVDGMLLDSKKEVYRYSELKLLLKAKEIRNLELQKAYVLQDPFKDFEGKHHRAITYLSDFTYEDLKTGRIVVEDVKASLTFQTQVYKLKKKLFLHRYPNIVFKEII